MLTAIISSVLILSVIGLTNTIQIDTMDTRQDITIIFNDEINQHFLDSIGANINYEFQTFSGVSINIPQSALGIIQSSSFIKSWEYNQPVHMYEDTIDWGVDRINAEVVWGGSEDAVDVTGTCGATVKVAVLDTGIDYTHPDLAPNYKGGYDFVDNDDDPIDEHYHGTHVSGTISAADDEPNALSGSLVGVSPCVELYAVRVLDDRGSGTSDGVAAGIDWAAANGMDVASLSLGSSSPSSVIEIAGQNAYAAGVLLVAASGNDGGEIGYPAAFPEFMAIGSTDPDDSLSSFSNFGPEQELVAPGRDIMSTTPTYLSSRGPFNPSPNYDTLSGTSMATPHVSGVAAMIYATDSTLTNVDVRQILHDSAEDLGAAGWDESFGYGIVDVPAAVELAGGSGGDPDDTTPPAQVTGLTATATSSSQIDLAWDANSESDLSYYNVYRDSVTIAQVAAGTTTFSDTGLAAATSYTYEVSAVDDSGNEGLKSDPVSATTSESTGSDGSMYVSDITFEEVASGNGAFATYTTYATVTVLDGDGVALEGVTAYVTVTMTDGSTESYSGTTDSNGQVVFSWDSRSCGTYTLTVDDLVLDGFTWDTNLGLISANFTNC